MLILDTHIDIYICIVYVLTLYAQNTNNCSYVCSLACVLLHANLIDDKQIKKEKIPTLTGKQMNNNSDLISDTAVYIIVIFVFCAWCVYTCIQDCNELQHDRARTFGTNFDRTVFII